MQASKIKVGKQYAVMHDTVLRRFSVSSVTTVRTRDTGSPHDYESTIGGCFVDTVTGQLEETAHKLDPQKILGPYEEHAELVAEKARQNAAANAIRQQKIADAHSVCAYLYGLIGRPSPKKFSDYNLPFRVPYGHGVEISAEGVQLLLELIKKQAA